MSTRLHIVVSDETVADIDRVRGDVPRSAWIRRLVMLELFGPASEQALGSSGRAGVRGRVPAPVPAEQPEMRGLEPIVRNAVESGNAIEGLRREIQRNESAFRGLAESDRQPRVRSSSEARPFRPVPKKGEK